MRKKTDLKNKKYKILERLKQLPYSEYRIAKEKLPIALDVSKRTFERWLYLTKVDKGEIPADKLAIIASFFGLGDNLGALLNYKVPKFNTKKLEKLKGSDHALIEEFQFVK